MKRSELGLRKDWICQRGLNHRRRGAGYRALCVLRRVASALPVKRGPAREFLSPEWRPVSDQGEGSAL